MPRIILREWSILSYFYSCKEPYRNRSSLTKINLAPAPGFEPGTISLTGSRSTAELRRNTHNLSDRGVIFNLYTIYVDTLAHGLWTAAVYKAAQKPKEKKYNIWFATFFGVAPDIFSFGILFAQTVFGFGYGRPRFGAGGTPDSFYVPAYVHIFYDWTHSLIVFAAAFLIVWLIRRKPLWEMLGWALHILIDIPTHISAFFPTPFLWPISNYEVSGISWGNPIFMAVNYSSLVLAYSYLVWRDRKSRKI